MDPHIGGVSALRAHCVHCVRPILALLDEIDRGSGTMKITMKTMKITLKGAVGPVRGVEVQPVPRRQGPGSTPGSLGVVPRPGNNVAFGLVLAP